MTWPVHRSGTSDLYSLQFPLPDTKLRSPVTPKMSYDVQSLEPKIRAILSAPGVDLTTISAKRVRKQLMEDDSALTADVVKDNKEEIDTLISQVFEEISGPQQDSGDEEETAQSSKRKKRANKEEYDDGEGEPRPAKKKAKKGQEKSDEKLARKLSNEINGRATRGASKSRSNGAAKSRAKKSATTIDSDDDDDDDDGGKKKKKRSGGGGGGGGGFKKEYTLRYACAF